MVMFETIYKDQSYTCTLEVFEGRAFFHVTVEDRLKLSDIKRGRSAFHNIKREVLERGYDRMYAVTPSPHFATLLGAGFEKLQQIEYDGKLQEMIVWELK